jgi:hypothetical protein
MRYRATMSDCGTCSLKERCCPTQPQRKVLRSIHEGARDLARDLSLTDANLTSRRERKKVEMLFAHLKRILKLDRLRLRGPNGAKDEFLLVATAERQLLLKADFFHTIDLLRTFGPHSEGRIQGRTPE